jgi:hypothetical protein
MFFLSFHEIKKCFSPFYIYTPNLITMKKFILFLFVLAAFSLNSQSQNDPNAGNPQPEKKKACCFKIGSLSISSGFSDYRTMGRSDKDFEKPSKDQNNWQSGNMGFMMGNKGGGITSRKYLTLEIGLNPYSKKLGDYNKKRELSVGLYYSGSDLADKNSIEFASTAGDTFSYNSVMYQADTISRTQRTYLEKANVLGASIQYLYKTDPEKRISLFTGYGINAAYAITARIHESYTKDSAVVVNFYGSKPNLDGIDNGTFLGSDEQKVSYKAKPTLFASVFIPFGINFRLCQKKEIWNQMNIFIKGSVGLETEIVVNSKTHFNPYMGCSMGFKFDLK